MEALATALLLWINRHSDYPMDGITPPTIVLLSPEEITAEYYSENRNFIPVNGIDDRILALYDFQTDAKGIVYLRVAENTLDNPAALDELKDDPVFQEKLLHELIHHVQYQSGQSATFPCRAFGEKEAYRLGGVFFKQRHVEDPIPNRNFWAHVYSRC